MLKREFWCDFNHLEETMERVLDRCNGDLIRNTMINQEEIFRNQLHELHRIYKVQKQMMVDLRSKEVKNHSAVSASPRMLSDTSLRRCDSTSISESSHSSRVSNSHNCTSRLQSEYDSLHPVTIRADCANRLQSVIDIKQPVKQYGSMEARTNHQITLFGKHLKEKSKIEGLVLWPEDESNIQLTLSIGR